MKASNCCFAFLLAVLAGAGVQALPNRSSQLWAAPQAGKFQDVVGFKYPGGGASGIGIRDKGGFTVVAMQGAAGGSKLSVSFAVKADGQRTVSDFRVIAVDAAGKRHEASAESKVSAGGNGLTVITLVAEFPLSSDKIDSLVIQQRVKGAT